MERTLLKAVTTATDEGTFEAVISTASVDRDGDIVEPSGLVTALKKWATVGKLVPLAWSHATTTDAAGKVHYVIVGHIDPASARVVGREVVAKGWIDRDAQHGKEAWRLVKSGTLSFSYGYLVPEGGATKRQGVPRGDHITELDVFEISIVPIGPANNETRVIGWKADVPMEQLLNAMLGMAQKFIDQEDDPDDIAAMQEVADRLKTLGAAEAAEPDDSAEDTSKALRNRFEAVALEVLTDGETGHKATPETKPDLPVGADWLFPEEELKAARAAELKAVWTTAYINGLPDSAFLHVDSGGSKDDEGKTTPRSLRHFPYKDDSGKVDLPHLRNALARIPQSNLPQNVKDSLTSKAQGILDNQKSVDATDKEHKARSVDPLREKVNALALEVASDGENLVRPPQVKAEPVTPLPSPEALRESVHAATLAILNGDAES